jgi:2-iminobutanoate/2-iminopropanoate deaminase
MKEIVHSTNALAPIGPYSQAVKAGNMLFASGQIALDPTTGKLVNASVAVETRQVLENVRAVLHAAGLTERNVVKTSIFLSDMSLFAEVNAVYAEYFNEDPPARETVAVAGLPMGVNVEISVTALFP